MKTFLSVPCPFSRSSRQFESQASMAPSRCVKMCPCCNSSGFGCPCCLASHTQATMEIVCGVKAPDATSQLGFFLHASLKLTDLWQSAGSSSASSRQLKYQASVAAVHTPVVKWRDGQASSGCECVRSHFPAMQSARVWTRCDLRDSKGSIENFIRNGRTLLSRLASVCAIAAVLERPASDTAGDPKSYLPGSSQTIRVAAMSGTQVDDPSLSTLEFSPGAGGIDRHSRTRLRTRRTGIVL